ncbi:MAG: hypothetical protein JJE21_07130 [Spirochaetaceae bacterium]|nr:hypothetical protein [Spirochaetaceae bacterium]
MPHKKYDDDLDLEEERYFKNDDYEDDQIEDFDELPLGDFEDDEIVDDIDDDEELLSENYLFDDDESYEEAINEELGDSSLEKDVEFDDGDVFDDDVEFSEEDEDDDEDEDEDLSFEEEFFDLIEDDEDDW